MLFYFFDHKKTCVFFHFAKKSKKQHVMCKVHVFFDKSFQKASWFKKTNLF